MKATRREFLVSASLAGAGLVAGASPIEAKATKAAPKQKSRKPTLADVGWVWEGQGIDPGVAPSIFGAGEGARYFGLRKAVFMFHPNNDMAMKKMSWMDEITCDISKWKYRWPETGGVAHWVDSKLESVKAEAQNVSRLSLKYRNVTGGFHDDMRGLVKGAGIEPAQYAEVYKALKSANPKLKLWTVVYTHELDEGWLPFSPYMDIVNLWVWKPEDLPALDAHYEKCRKLFPDKPINLGCYLRDYTARAPVPMDKVKFQWEWIAKAFDAGEITGYSILAAVLIDGHEEQAEWIKNFIASHSR